MCRFYWDRMLDVYENMTTVRLYNECEANGAGESIEIDRDCLFLGLSPVVTVICLECVINFV